MVAGDAVDVRQRSGSKFDDHENFFGDIVVRAETEARRWLKSEARVVGGMAEDEDGVDG